MAFQRGLDEKHEQNQHFMLRDTRPLSTRILDFFKSPHGVAYFLLALAVVTFIMGYLAEIFLIIGISGFVYCMTRKTKLPFNLASMGSFQTKFY